MKNKLGLEVSLVLPSVPGARDACVQRLLALLKQDGVERAHVVGEDSRAKLCVHYDPDRFDIAELRRLVLAAGSRIEQRYRHESVRLDGMDCSTWATVVEHALGRMPGDWASSRSSCRDAVRLGWHRPGGAGARRVDRGGCSQRAAVAGVSRPRAASQHGVRAAW